MSAHNGRRPLQTNAADPRQINAADRLERRRADRWEDQLLGVMATPVGRAFIWALLRRTGMYETPFDLHGGKQSFNIGRGDVGRQLLDEVIRLAPDEYLVMEAEARKIDALEDRAVAASHTATADGTGE